MKLLTRSQHRIRLCVFHSGLRLLYSPLRFKTNENAPLAAVSWSFSKQRDRFSQCSEASLHLRVVSGDGDLSRSPPPLKRSKRFLLPLADSLLQLQSLSCTASWETRVFLSLSHTHPHQHLNVVYHKSPTRRNVDVSCLNPRLHSITS